MEKKTHEFLELDDILSLWDKRSKSKWKQKLIMIADCCHSGEWVLKLKQKKYKDIYMQASCGNKEISMDGEYGSVFTSNYINFCMWRSNGLRAIGALGYIRLIVGGAVSWVVSLPVVLVWDVIIKGLYNAAKSSFTPVCYNGEADEIWIGSEKDDNGHVWDTYLDFTSSWMAMDATRTRESFMRYGTGHVSTTL